MWLEEESIKKEEVENLFSCLQLIVFPVFSHHLKPAGNTWGAFTATPDFFFQHLCTCSLRMRAVQSVTLHVHQPLAVRLHTFQKKFTCFYIYLPSLSASQKSNMAEWLPCLAISLIQSSQLSYSLSLAKCQKLLLVIKCLDSEQKLCFFREIHK